MTAPTVEGTQVQHESTGEAFGLALLWLMPVIGFLLALLGLA